MTTGEFYNHLAGQALWEPRELANFILINVKHTVEHDVGWESGITTITTFGTDSNIEITRDNVFIHIYGELQDTPKPFQELLWSILSGGIKIGVTEVLADYTDGHKIKVNFTVPGIMEESLAISRGHYSLKGAVDYVLEELAFKIVAG